MTSVFYLFRDAPQRRAALGLEPGSPARYGLYGMDELVARGHAVRHNLERPAPATWARVAGGTLTRCLEAAGGYGGDFATVLSSLRAFGRADVVLEQGLRLVGAGLAPPPGRKARLDAQAVAADRSRRIWRRMFPTIATTATMKIADPITLTCGGAPMRAAPQTNSGNVVSGPELK